MYLNTLNFLMPVISPCWIVTLDVFKYAKVEKLQENFSSWIVTLDVFKSIPTGYIVIANSWIVTLDVFKCVQRTFRDFVCHCWIVTLDVFKCYMDERYGCKSGSWIVTLDVFKFNKLFKVIFFCILLNSNIRCI